MGFERDARLFRNGRSQAVRIPKDFELPGNDVIIRKDGERLIIEPKRKRTLKEALDYLRTLPPLEENERFPEIEDLPAEPFDL